MFTNFEIMVSKSKVYFFSDDTAIPLRNRDLVKRQVEHIFKKEKKKLGSINYIFCSDKRILQINRKYLKHDFYTDIITFSLAESGFPIHAEVYISVPRIRENAKMLQQPFKTELLRVIFHGALHLCGYKDKPRKDKGTMRSREDFYLNYVS